MSTVLRSFSLIVLKIFFKLYFLIFGTPKLNKDAVNLLNLYQDDNFSSWFKRIRFWDAPFVEVEKLVPKKGLVVDLGCGEGIFTNYLALCSPKRKIIGVDIDENRILQADKGLKNVQFQKMDATKLEIPDCNTVIMFHLLHHLSSKKAQEELIVGASQKIKKGGKLIIVEVAERPFLKYLISWFTDHFIVAWIFERKLYESNISFRSKEDWLAIFDNLNLKTRVYNENKGKPFSHIVFVATK